MSATLRSFDLDGESVGNVSHNGTVGSNRYQNSNRNSSFRESKNLIESDEDIEFDDTRIETPQRNNFRTVSSRESNGGSSIRSSSHKVRKTTLKVPLNDERGSSRKSSGRYSSPYTSQLNRYRSTNGTPLRYTSGISNEVNSSKNAHNIEDDLIRENKLISDDNRFTPGNMPTTQSSPMKNRNSIANDAPTFSPPSHLKIKPLSSFRLNEQEQSTRKNSSVPNTPSKSNQKQERNEDIEFDSSDSEKEQAPVKLHQEIVKNPNTIENNLQEQEKQKDVEEISRTDLLERINNTINSIKENDISHAFPSSPNKKDNPGSFPSGRNLFSEVEKRMPMISDSESVSSESQIEILNELDSHILNKNNTEISRSVSPARLDTFHPFIENRTQGIPSDVKQHVDYSGLRGRLYNGVQSKLSNEISSHSLDNSRYQKKTSILEDSPKEWSLDKWHKLLKVLEVSSISKIDIVNSEVLLGELGCSSRDELRSRVDFLLEYQRVCRRRSNRVSHKRKNKKSRVSKTVK